MTPETGTLPQDGTKAKEARGRARLHEREQDKERPTRASDHPIEKFKRVWHQDR
jgi:hypothetical protein